MAEEQELQTKDLPPLTNVRHPTTYYNKAEETADSSSLHSYSTLSSATTTRSASMLTPQQSASHLYRQQQLQQKYDEEYQQLKQERSDLNDLETFVT